MSKARQDWFGVSLYPDVSIQKQTTLFPLTFEEGISENEKTIHPCMEDAHRLILKEGMNPYAAWTQALHIIKERLLSLGLAATTIETLLNEKHPLVSAKTVLKFCVEFGIHPAHLQPGIANEGLQYDSSIMKAIVEIIKPKRKKEITGILKCEAIPQADLDLCMRAFVAEESRYKKMLQTNAAMAGYFEDAMKRVAVRNGKKSIPQSLSVYFKASLKPHPSDLMEGFEKYEQAEAKHIEESKENLRDHETRLSHLKNELIKYSDVLFGKADSKKALDLIINNIEEINMGSYISEDFWIDIKEEISNACIPLKSIPKSEEYLPFPRFDLNFELYAERQGQDPEEVKERFLDLLEIYMRLKEKYLCDKISYEGKIEAFNVYQHWREEEATTEQRIPLFKNHSMIEPFLPEEQKRLPAPEAYKPTIEQIPK